MLTPDDLKKLRHVNLKMHPRAMLRDAMTCPDFWTPISAEGESAGVDHRRYEVARQLVKRGLGVRVQRRVGGRRRFVFELTPVGIAFCRAFASEILFGGPIRSSILKTRARRLSRKASAAPHPPAASAA